MVRQTTVGKLSSPKLPHTGILITATTLALSGLMAYTFWRYRPTPAEPAALPETVVPEIKTVTALGWLEPQGEIIKLSAPQSNQGSRVDQLLVKEGDLVEGGQAIAILDSRDRLQAALEQAKTEVEVAVARLEQVQAGAKQGDIQAQKARFQGNQAELDGQIITQKATIATLEAQLRGERSAQKATLDRIQAELNNAETNCQRYDNLYQDGAVSAQDRDSQCLQAETSRKRLQEAQANLNETISSRAEQIREAQANLSRTIATVDQQIAEAQATLTAVSEVRPVDVKLAKSELTKAQASVKQANVNLEQAYVRSPQAGRVIEVNTHAGELISNEGIIELGQTEQMYAVAEVYDSDIPKIHSGQIATITADALPEPLKGTVEEVGLRVKKQSALDIDPTTNIDARVIEVRVKLDDISSKKAGSLTNLQVKVKITQ
ncbi:heterocyst specific ABC-transporter, membrane fusion protein DevB-like protein [Planktothrix agardhii CCAP 1459/11A]|uniref:Heterocyst specific ABC-transporter, membrane fusion protein DevB-like protein n=1 Tax=Planktothrix agardhii CCAP 1459/11A TaxID=282420 RepID=A0A4P5Z8X3_PLAAG|nr:ABC exporter membrane fusion protein [Planktothrix agardhii]GDZ92480.1 heterocyst specific ABC-transporter, membrane fusion protein DevB-like protein [Planktothrix agardhii CCAP 1459/11A]